MNSATLDINSVGRLRVRPIVLMGCAISLAGVLLPQLFRHRLAAQFILLLAASVCVIWGWFLQLKYKEADNNSWRGKIAVASSVYLVVSIPAFFFELRGLGWLIHHNWTDLYRWTALYYVRLWVHWGFILVYLGVVASFFGRGRSRVAFVLGGATLMILWESMPRWIL